MISLAITIKSVRLAPEEIPPAIRAFLSEAGALVEKCVRQDTPQGVGGTASGLRGSLFNELHESPGLFTEIIGSNLAYAEPVDAGTKPHFPPVAALIPWVEKFITLEHGETAESVAFLIARAIARRGTPAVRMFERGLEAAQSLLPAMAERLGLDIAARLVKPADGGTR